MSATKTVAVGLRVQPRLKFLADLMARRQRRTLTAIFEDALRELATDEDWLLFQQCWHVDAGKRLANLYMTAPNLCTYEEEVAALILLEHAK